MEDGGWRMEKCSNADLMRSHSPPSGELEGVSGELEGVLLLQYHVNDGAQIRRVDGATAIYVGLVEVEALRLYTIH